MMCLVAASPRTPCMDTSYLKMERRDTSGVYGLWSLTAKWLIAGLAEHRDKNFLGVGRFASCESFCVATNPRVAHD